MNLVFDMLDASRLGEHTHAHKRFEATGGVIGRGDDCDWVIPDRNRYLSKHHARVSQQDGVYCLTDISSNGIRLKHNGERLRKGEAYRIEHGSVYCLGDFEIRARFEQSSPPLFERPGQGTTTSIIPDDAFLDPAPQWPTGERASAGDPFGLWGTSPPARQMADHASIEKLNLPLPELVVAATVEATPVPPATPTRQADGFWQRFASALGLSVDDMDDDAREALALRTAKLLRQCVDGVQCNLRTRAELHRELHLSPSSSHDGDHWSHTPPANSGMALNALLRPESIGELADEQSLVRALRDLQAHQVALVAASRATLSAALDDFAPDRLSLRFEHEGQLSRLFGAASRWKAYRRHHQALRQDSEWSERLLQGDFARAYHEQLRLIATLNDDTQG